MSKVPSVDVHSAAAAAVMVVQGALPSVVFLPPNRRPAPPRPTLCPCSSPAEGAYSEGFIRAKFTQDYCIGRWVLGSGGGRSAHIVCRLRCTPWMAGWCQRRISQATAPPPTHPPHTHPTPPHPTHTHAHTHHHPTTPPPPPPPTPPTHPTHPTRRMPRHWHPVQPQGRQHRVMVPQQPCAAHAHPQGHLPHARDLPRAPGGVGHQRQRVWCVRACVGGQGLEGDRLDATTRVAVAGSRCCGHSSSCSCRAAMWLLPPAAGNAHAG